MREEALLIVYGRAKVHHTSRAASDLATRHHHLLKHVFLWYTYLPGQVKEELSLAPSLHMWQMKMIELNETFWLAD